MKNRLHAWIFAIGISGFSLSSLGTDIPIISDVSMSQGNDRLVTITYQVTGNPGIITIDIETNGVSIGASNYRNVSGDVNCEVGIGSHTITWRPDKSWQGQQVDAARVKISGWAKSSPPDYMAVQLIPPYRKRWYASEASLPGGIDSDRYRDNVLLMRRIDQPEGGVWRMGSPESPKEIGRYANEKTHHVTLTEVYWIGVFELTQRQWEIVKGKRASSEAFKYDGSFRPADTLHYGDLRGSDPGSYYPNAPATNSFIGILRSKTCLPFDLPSEMQWEYACRAGNAAAFNNGGNLVTGSATVSNPDLDQLGRYSLNGGKTEGSARVGSYLPNAWGLYDMHGNVWEWCLDWYADDISGLNGAVNTAIHSEGLRVMRGGGFSNQPRENRSAMRNKSAQKGYRPPNAGLRLVLPLGQ